MRLRESDRTGSRSRVPRRPPLPRGRHRRPRPCGLRGADEREPGAVAAGHDPVRLDARRRDPAVVRAGARPGAARLARGLPGAPVGRWARSRSTGASSRAAGIATFLVDTGLAPELRDLDRPSWPRLGPGAGRRPRGGAPGGGGGGGAGLGSGARGVRRGRARDAGGGPRRGRGGREEHRGVPDRAAVARGAPDRHGSWWPRCAGCAPTAAAPSGSPSRWSTAGWPGRPSSSGCRCSSTSGTATGTSTWPTATRCC